MKDIKFFYLVLILLTAGISCKKNGATEDFSPIAIETKPDLSAKIITSVEGFIVDDRDSAVVDALITAGNKTVLSDNFGHFKINNTSISKAAGFIKVEKNGFFKGFRSFITKEGTSSFCRIKLSPKTSSEFLEASTGGVVTTIDGAKITLPGDAVVLASDNSQYTGLVRVSAHWINPAGSDIPLTMQGSLLGIDSSGYLKCIGTFGMLLVELTSEAGQLLQLAPGKEASLDFPIPSSLQAYAPSTVPLWYLDETNGLWKEQGAALKNGNLYSGKVSHFSAWNCDMAAQSVSLSVQLVDSNLVPLKCIRTIIKGFQFGNLTFCDGYTDSSGHFYGLVPANADLELNILTECNDPVYSRKFSTVSSGADLGTIIAGLKQFSLSISGQAVNCSSVGIVDGIAILTGASGYNLGAEIKNGFFSFNNLKCANSGVMSITIFDRLTSTKSKIIPITPGATSVGKIVACQENVNQFANFVIDNKTSAFLIPPYISNSGLQDTVTLINILNPIDSAVVIGATFGGGSGLGSGHKVLNVKLGLQTYSWTTPTFATITEYGPVGGYISGSFTNRAIGSADSTQHNVSCTFRVKRKT